MNEDTTGMYYFFVYLVDVVSFLTRRHRHRSAVDKTVIFLRREIKTKQKGKGKEDRYLRITEY
jgi:hypothetical protein